MSESLEPRLAVILHADVIGSTSLVQHDESLAHRRMVDAFHRLGEAVEEHAGEVREIRGDALLAVFQRGSDAVNAALHFQRDHTAHGTAVDDPVWPELRIGIAIGEVIVADGTMTGAGVVLAQRLEQLADAGGVVIQGAVCETLPKRLPVQFESLGEQVLKGFDAPVRAYSASLSAAAPAQDEQPPASTDAQVAIASEKPTIAVLPFSNRSDDPEQEYFSDGISEDIIAELSRFHALFVIARNSSFRFKGQDVSIQQVGSELGVPYIVEGSVRRAGNRVRIRAQLVEVETENQVWAERYDRELKDIFEVQDEVTRSIVAVLPGRVQEDVVERAARKPTHNMKAYELVLQGKAQRDLLSAEGNAAARRFCERAIELDPRYARAYMYLSDSYIVDIWLGLGAADARDLAMRYARQAAELDGNDMYIQDHLGYAHLACGLWREAEVQFDKTLAKIVNEAESMAWCGYAYLLMGKLDKAHAVVLEAMRLDPLHPPAIDWVLGQVCYFREDYERVIDVMYGKSLLNSVAYAFVAAAHARLGHRDSAAIALDAFVAQRHREFDSRGIAVAEDTVESLVGAYRVMWKEAASWERLAEGLRMAGLPG